MNLHALDSLRKAFDDGSVTTKAGAESIEPDGFGKGDVGSEGHDVVEISESFRGGPMNLLELILKDPIALERLIRQPGRQAELIPRFVSISLVGFTLFGVAMTLVLSAASVWPHLFAIASVLEGRQDTVMRFEQANTTSIISPWLNGQAFKLIIAYTIGLIAATGICLPSLYFYGLLAGVRMTMRDIAIHAVKSKAVAAVTLVGILPIYAAFGLAIAIFPLPDSLRDVMLGIGLILPFLAGLAGTWSLYRGLSMLTDTMNPERRVDRECFLQRLVLSWSMVYSAVSPVLIFTLWQRLQG